MKTKIIVIKVGGAVMSDPAGILFLYQYVKEMLFEAKCPVILIVSAMGKTTQSLNSILESGNVETEINSITEFTMNLASKILKPLHMSGGFDSFEKNFRGHMMEVSELAKKELTITTLSAVLSKGELIAQNFIGNLFTFRLWKENTGVSTKYLGLDRTIVLDTFTPYIVNFSDICINTEKTRVNFKSFSKVLNAQGMKPSLYIAPGFLGITVGGKISIMGKDSSDVSLAVTACELGASKAIFLKKTDFTSNVLPYSVFEKDAERAIEKGGSPLIHPIAIQLLRMDKIPTSIFNYLNKRTIEIVY